MNNQFFNPYNGIPIRNISYIPNATRSISPFMNSVGPALTRSSPLSFLTGARSPLSVTGAVAKTGFSWSGLLNGASKTLGVINQAIPVFYQVKPIVNNAKTMFRVVKEINSSDNKTSSANVNSTVNEVSNNTSNSNSNNENEPQFFV